MDGPITFFGESLTQIHCIGRDKLEELHRFGEVSAQA